ncbi:hypothetical protein ACJQWK_04193 [Exserohilum turcicum]
MTRSPGNRVNRQKSDAAESAAAAVAASRLQESGAGWACRQAHPQFGRGSADRTAVEHRELDQSFLVHASSRGIHVSRAARGADRRRAYWQLVRLLQAPSVLR